MDCLPACAPLPSPMEPRIEIHPHRCRWSCVPFSYVALCFDCPDSLTGCRVVLQRVRTVVRLLHQHRGLKSLFFVRPAGCGERGITPNCGRDGGLEGHVEVSGWTTHRSPRVPPTFPRQPNRKGGRGEGDAASPAIKHCRRMMDTRNEITGLEIRGKGRRCQIVRVEGELPVGWSLCCAVKALSAPTPKPRRSCPVFPGSKHPPAPT